MPLRFESASARAAITGEKNMKLSDMRGDKARLFSPSALSLDVTDPEYAEIIARFAFLEVTPELADETVLWLRNCAEEAKEPFATVIQQAAEYLHDFWAEVIHTLPDESTAE